VRKLELEIRTPSSELPFLSPVPQPGPPANSGWSIPSPTEKEPDRRTRLKLRMRQPVPGDLQIRLSVTVTTETDNPDSWSWTDLGLYRMPARAGAELNVAALHDYGFDPVLRLVEIAPKVYVKPELTNLPASLRVIAIQDSVMGPWEVVLRNCSTLDIHAIVSQVPGRGHWDQESYSGGCPLVPALGTGSMFLPPLEDSREWRLDRDGPLVAVAAVYYGDGTCEGDRVRCARLAATREWRRAEVSRQLELLGKVSVGEILQDLNTFLAGLPIEPPLNPLVENSEEAALLARFPELSGSERMDTLYQLRTTTRHLRADLRALIESLDELRDRPDEILKRLQHHLSESHRILAVK